MSDFDFPYETTDELGEYLYQVRDDGLVERQMMIPQGYSFNALDDARTRKIFLLDVQIQNDIWIGDQKPCAKCGARWHVGGKYAQWAVIEHSGHAVAMPIPVLLEERR